MNRQKQKSGRSRSLTPEQEADVLAQRAAGVSLRTLAEKHGVTRSVIWRVGRRSVDRAPPKELQNAIDIDRG